MQTVSLATSAILVEVNISCWTANKIDRAVTDEVNTVKKASKHAAKVSKNLLADDPRLSRILKCAADIRNWLARCTLPWADSGARIISTAQFMDFKQELDARKQVFDDMVADFVAIYPTLISAQAFKLGTMFNRDEFPSDVDVARKFSMRYSFLPIPEAGDFRVDVADDVAAALREQYEAEYAARTVALQGELWGRLKSVLDKINDRLSTDEAGKNKVFRDTLIDNALEVCSLLRVANVTGDAALEAARKEAEQAILGVTPDELRKNANIRADVKARVEDVLAKFDW